MVFYLHETVGGVPPWAPLSAPLRAPTEGRRPYINWDTSFNKGFLAAWFDALRLFFVRLGVLDVLKSQGRILSEWKIEVIWEIDVDSGLRIFSEKK